MPTVYMFAICELFDLFLSPVYLGSPEFELLDAVLLPSPTW